MMMLSLSTDGTIKTDDNVITSITVEEVFFISLFFYRTLLHQRVLTFSGIIFK